MYLIVAGLFGGFLAGLLGVGGGILFILILPFALTNFGVCDADIISATIANSILGTFIASLSANIRSIVKKDFAYKPILIIGISAGLTSILVMNVVVAQSWYNKTTFNLLVIALMLFMLVRMFLKSKSNHTEKPLKPIALLGIGMAAGSIAALSGLGGGIIIIPILINFFHIPIKKVKTISLGVIGIIAIFLTTNNLFTVQNCAEQFVGQIGLVVFPVTLIMSVGVAIGSPLGVKFSKSLSEETIKLLFSILLLFAILRKIYEIAEHFQWL